MKLRCEILLLLITSLGNIFLHALFLQFNMEENIKNNYLEIEIGVILGLGNSKGTTQKLRKQEKTERTSVHFYCCAFSLSVAQNMSQLVPTKKDM